MPNHSGTLWLLVLAVSSGLSPAHADEATPASPPEPVVFTTRQDHQNMMQLDGKGGQDSEGCLFRGAVGHGLRLPPDLRCGKR